LGPGSPGSPGSRGGPGGPGGRWLTCCSSAARTVYVCGIRSGRPVTAGRLLECGDRDAAEDRRPPAIAHRVNTLIGHPDSRAAAPLCFCRDTAMIEMAHPLVGRDRELNVLDRMLREACAGSSRFVVLSGEPGIGKTSLIAELGRQGQAAGCLVLQGRATELERDFPFGLIVDALDAYLESLDARSFERLAAEELGELASVFPALRSLRPASPPPSTAAERFRAHYAVRELIERLAAPRPLVLTLDDVQWSDGASLELIGHLLRRPPDAAVMLAASIRTGQSPRRIAAAIGAAARMGTVTLVELGPLDRSDSDRLVGAAASSDLKLLYRESGGNPFYLLQLARAAPSPQAAASGPEWTDAREVPAAVRASIAAELDGLSAQGRAFAQAAAVAGDPFELDLAIATAAMAAPNALAALDELVACEVLRPGDLPRRFRFRHPLVRAAIYAACPPGTRLLCHERAAAALEAQGAPAISRAHHVAHSARHGDARAVVLLRDAGLDVSQRAPASAAIWFEAAIRILPTSTPSGERLGLLAALAGAYAATGRLQDSRDVLLSGVELAARQDLSTRVGLTSACAKIELLLGRREEAQARLLNALAEVSESAPAIAARLMVALASSAFYGADIDGVRDWASRALDATHTHTHTHEDRVLSLGALAILALAEASEGPVAEAQAHCSQASALVDAMPDEELAGGLDALADLCGAEFQLQRFVEAEAHARRGLALARATSRGDLFPWISLVLSGVLYSTGRLAEATELIEGLVEAARLTDNAIGLASALVNGAATSLAAGDVDGALDAAQEAVALTREMTPSVVAAWGGGFAGAALLEAGQPERAAETIVRAGGGDELPLIPGAFRVGFLEILTRAYLAAGRRDEAKRTAELAQHRAEQFDLDASSATAELATAAVELEAGDASPAAVRALAAAERAERVGARHAAGLARSLAGRALAALGETERAAAELELAVSELQVCGARRHLAAAERELRRLGRTVHHRNRASTPQGAGVESLTGRELEVARLVVDRRTNPEIAAELFLSIKTVETHLRNIFRKLDASSRVQVARIIERAQAAAGRAP
jgi:DNA-binding CsgD family transcriptional regulator/tetratricopeptide (TPR) repeat protein